MKIENTQVINIEQNKVKESPQKSNLDKVLLDFEAMLMSRFYESIAEDLEPDPLTGGGYTEKIYRSFLFEELAKVSAEANGIFLTKDIKNKLYAKYGK